MAALLAESGVSDALSGYQEGKQHIREILQSAYNILAQQKIAYAVAPASFNGQRIRFAPEIFHEKLANCLDFSLLFASIFEQCGLHPLILLTDNHAFVGCHAIDTSLSDAFSEDIQAVKKRVQLDEIFLFETTCALGSQPSSFKYAEEKAIKHLEESNFEGVLDIYQSRKEKFMPLPLKTNGNEVSIDEKYSFKNTGNSFDERVRTERTIIEVG